MERSIFSLARCVLAALCLVLVVTGTAIAQDPRASAAQAAARDWLMLTDRGDAQASWDAASERFRAAMPLSGWGNELSKERVPLGAMRSRATLKTSFTKIFPGVPKGDYALVSFETSFAKRPQGHETVTLEHEDDGNWRVVGYFVR